jgi:hypothetical protein
MCWCRNRGKWCACGSIAETDEALDIDSMLRPRHLARMRRRAGSGAEGDARADPSDLGTLILHIDYVGQRDDPPMRCSSCHLSCQFPSDCEMQSRFHFPITDVQCISEV